MVWGFGYQQDWPSVSFGCLECCVTWDCKEVYPNLSLLGLCNPFRNHSSRLVWERRLLVAELLYCCCRRCRRRHRPGSAGVVSEVLRVIGRRGEDAWVKRRRPAFRCSIRWTGWDCFGYEELVEGVPSWRPISSSFRVCLVPNVQAVHLVGQRSALRVRIVSGIDSIRYYIGHEVT